MLAFARKYSAYMKPKVFGKIQVSETDRPTDIITNSPSIATRFPFHLDAFLFDSPPDPIKAAECHQDFCKTLKKMSGANVLVVDEVLKSLDSKQLRAILIDSCQPKFLVSPDPPISKFNYQFQREYIEESLSKLSNDDLIDLILLNPSINLTVDNSSTGFSYTTIPVSPLSNLVFTRDQQVATSKGLVIGRFGAQQRLSENRLMSIFWSHVGLNPIGEIKYPATLEGGDFFPINHNLSLLGIGPRTNRFAAQQLMDGDLVGTQRFVLVESMHDYSQEHSHLDTFFNIIDENTCVCLDSVARDHGNNIRLAVEYVKAGDHYFEVRRTPFGKWLREEGFNVIEVSQKDQRNYFIDFLNLGKDSHGRGRILAVDENVGRVLKKNGFNGDVQSIDFAPITSLYGGIHSATFCLRTHS